jgi:hypothetical protein
MKNKKLIASTLASIALVATMSACGGGTTETAPVAPAEVATSAPEHDQAGVAETLDINNWITNDEAASLCRQMAMNDGWGPGQVSQRPVDVLRIAGRTVAVDLAVNFGGGATDEPGVFDISAEGMFMCNITPFFDGSGSDEAPEHNGIRYAIAGEFVQELGRGALVGTWVWDGNPNFTITLDADGGGVVNQIGNEVEILSWTSAPIDSVLIPLEGQDSTQLTWSLHGNNDVLQLRTSAGQSFSYSRVS